MFNKFACMLLCLVFVVSCFSGCSDNATDSDTFMSEASVYLDTLTSAMEADDSYLYPTEYFGDGTKVLFDGDKTGVLESVGDTVRELDDGIKVNFVGYNPVNQTFMFEAVNDSEDCMLSIQSVKLIIGDDEIVADDLVFPEFDMNVDDPTDADYLEEYYQSCLDMYNAGPGSTLAYTATFSKLKEDLTEFELSMNGYVEYEVEYDGEMQVVTDYVDLKWTCSMS